MDKRQISPNSLNCNSGLDRLSIVLKVEKWLGVARAFKIEFLKKKFFKEDYSVPLSQLTKTQIKRLEKVSKKIPIVSFTSTRIQFKNEEKVLRDLLKKTDLSYNKERDCYAVAENYKLDLTQFSDEEASEKGMVEWIWTSIPLFSIQGTGQFKFGNRLGRQRTFVNRKLKETRFLFIQRRTVELMRKNKGYYNNVARENVALFGQLKNAKESRGLIFKTRTEKNSDGRPIQYVSLFRVLPNGYKLKSKHSNKIIRSNVKTFNYTKKASNQIHFKTINGRPKGNGRLEFKSSNERLKSSEKKRIEFMDYIPTQFEITKRNGTKVKLEGSMEVMKRPYGALSFQLKNLYFLKLRSEDIEYRKIHRNIR